MVMVTNDALLDVLRSDEEVRAMIMVKTWMRMMSSMIAYYMIWTS